MAEYLVPMRYFSAIFGPVANRIAGAQMAIAGSQVALDRNEAGRTTLHGGIAGFSERNWYLVRVPPSECQLTLHHLDGFGSFPSNIHVTAIYRLDAHGALEVEIAGQTDVLTDFISAFHGY
jgi:aldose 1-epimerase